MIRRRLTAYTCMMIAGISAGYFLSEKIRPLSAAGVLFGFGVAVILFERINSKERKNCFLILITGFLLFSLNFIYYESSVPQKYSEEYSYSFKGRIINAEDRNDFIRLTVRLDEDKKGRRCKIIADVKNGEPDAADDADRRITDYIGAKAYLYGCISEFRDADNPGCFDYRDYMRSKGIAFRLKVQSAEYHCDDNIIWLYKRKLSTAREDFLSQFDENRASFLRGLVFGDKSEIDEDVIKEFQLNSTGHILAVSGLHIGFLYALLRFLSARNKTWPASLFIITVMIIYGEMTMWSSSVIRAVIVLSLSILSVNLRKPFDLLTSISAAAFIILVFRPYMLFNSGFQLSFGAMSAIAFFSKRISKYLGEFLAVTFSVQIGTIPLIAGSFHRVNLIAFLINIPIITLSSVLVPMSILLLLVNILIGRIPGFAVSLIEFGVEALLMINHKLSFDGAFSNLSSGAGTAWTVTFLIAEFILSSEWFRINVLRKDYKTLRNAFILLLIPIIFMHSALYDPFCDDEIVFVSVGQGDCTHIRVGDNDILIDGGGTDFTNTGEKTLMPYLLYERTKDVDAALLTHLHKDHYLGIRGLAEIYPVSTVAFSEDYKESYENQKDISFNCNKAIYLTPNSSIQVDEDVGIEVIWPAVSSSGQVSIDDANEHNMVYLLNYKGVKVMITGDLLEEDEMKMIEHYKGTERLKCDILKVAHHGSKSSSSEEFLDAVSPSIAVIQVDINNLYGHPHRQTLERLEERGIKVFRTDKSGAIGIDIKKNGIIVDTMR